MLVTLVAYTMLVIVVGIQKMLLLDKRMSCYFSACLLLPAIDIIVTKNGFVHK